MKKFLFILMAAALALPMMSQTKAEEAAYRAGFRTAKNVVVQKQQTLERKHFMAPLREEVPAGYASVTLAAGDVWGDGSGYQMLFDADATAYGTIIPETGGLTTGGDADASIYAQFEYMIPENADGACNTANIVINNAITIYIPAGVYDYVITNPTPGDRVWIATDNGTALGRADNFEFVDGGIYTFTVSLGGQNDQVDLEIFDPNAPVMPENVAVDPATGVVTWENDHDPFFNLRYRVYTPNAAQTLAWDFETEESLEGWISYDNDGDGNGFRLDNSTDYYGNSYAHSGQYYIASDSYYGGALSPDNWLISPEITLGGTLSFFARNHSATWLDKFMVYVTTGEYDDLESYVPISEFITPSTEYTEYVFDLSQYEGKGYFAIRHYDCTDQFRLYFDDFSYNVPGDEEAEWIYVGTEDNEFALENLVPGTTYEVQVQAQGEDQRVSPWTASTIFTYEGEVGPIEPTEQTAAPSSQKENYVFESENLKYNAYTVTLIETEPSTIYYRIGVMVDGEYVYGEWMEYTGEMNFTEEGTYMIEAYAVAENKLPSEHIWDGFTVSKVVDVEELMAGKTVAGVRYYNMMGQEMQQANGVTIMVTTYTDGTTSAVKVVK